MPLVVRSDFIYHGAEYVAMADGAEEEVLLRAVLSLLRPEAVPEKDVERGDTSHCMKITKGPSSGEEPTS